ncbi:MAG: uracil-DNA glycosylase family protein [Panacagrimonas sp.]
MTTLSQLLDQVRACDTCAVHLPLGPRPVLRVDPRVRLLIIGQAPGTKVHASGVPWNDASGDRLRNWLNLDRERFYDGARVGVMPMGFCYPGRGRGGDLPPRPECAPQWHARLLEHMPAVGLTLLVGQYAQARYLDTGKQSLEETVRRYREYLLDRFLPLPHPSPRNTLWLKRRPWFESEVVPALRETLDKLGMYSP